MKYLNYAYMTYMVLAKAVEGLWEWVAKPFNKLLNKAFRRWV